MGIFNWIKGKKKKKSETFFDNDLEDIANKLNPIHKSIKGLEKYIIKNFNESKIIGNYNISSEEVDIKYWFQEIIIKRAEVDFIGAKYIYDKDASIEEKLIKNIQGHFDTYKQKYNDEFSVSEIYEHMRLRILMFRSIYLSIQLYFSKLKKDGINDQNLIGCLKLVECHTVASLYSCISFAKYNLISKKDIIEWFPEFESDSKKIAKIDAELWKPKYVVEKDIKSTLTAYDLIFDDSKKDNFIYEDDYNDKLLKEVSDEEWKLEYIEEELLESNDYENFAIIIQIVKSDFINENSENEIRDFERMLLKYIDDKIRINYIFVKNMCKYVELKITNNKTWTFENNAENRLYDMRYPSIIPPLLTYPGYNISHELDSLIDNASLTHISNKIIQKLNEYDNLKRSYKFSGYEFLDQVQTRCRIILKYLNEDRANTSKINSDELNLNYNRNNISEMNVIGNVIHHKGKPFTGLAYNLFEDGNLQYEYNMINGLKHGLGQSFDENGNLIETSFYNNDEIKASINISENGYLHYCEILSGGKITDQKNLEYHKFYRNQKDNNIWFFKPLENSYQEKETLFTSSINELIKIDKNSEIGKDLMGYNYLMAEAGLKYILIFNSDFNPPSIDTTLTPLPELEIKENSEHVFFNGMPFTGVGYELHLTGQISLTITFKNGMKNGVCNEYDENGMIIKNNYWVDGEIYLST